MSNSHPPGTDRCLHCAVIALAIKYVEAGQSANDVLDNMVEALGEFISANHSRKGRRQMVSAIASGLGEVVRSKRGQRAMPDIEDTGVQ